MTAAGVRSQGPPGIGLPGGFGTVSSQSGSRRGRRGQTASPREGALGPHQGPHPVDRGPVLRRSRAPQKPLSERGKRGTGYSSLPRRPSPHLDAAPSPQTSQLWATSSQPPYAPGAKTRLRGYAGSHYAGAQKGRGRLRSSLGYLEEESEGRLAHARVGAQASAHSKDGHWDGACAFHPIRFCRKRGSTAGPAGRTQEPTETGGESHAVSVYWCFRLMQHPAYKKGEISLIIAFFFFFLRICFCFFLEKKPRQIRTAL